MSKLFLAFSCVWSLIMWNLTMVTYKTIDNDFVPYVSEYYKLIDSYCKDGDRDYNNSEHFQIKFSKQDDDIIGVCYMKLNGYKIEIDPDFWERANEQQRRQLMYHELSHCVLYRMHDPNNFHYMHDYFVYELPNNTLKSQVTQDMYNRCHTK